MNPYQEFINCQKDFSYFLKTYVKVKHPAQGLIPLDPHKCQKELVELYDTKKHVIVIKIRNAGILTLSVLYALHKCMFFPNHFCFVASKTDREAIHTGKIVDATINYFPDWFKPKLLQNTKNTKVFANTNSRLSFGSIETIRGKAITHLFLDEPAFFHNMEDHWKTIIHPTNVYALSTTNGVGNWFYDTWDDAIQERNMFTAYKPNYKDVPFYNENNIEELKTALGEKGWQQEVEGNFIGNEPEFCVFDFTQITTKQLLSKAVKILNHPKLDFEEKAIVYEIMKRLAQMTK